VLSLHYAHRLPVRNYILLSCWNFPKHFQPNKLFRHNLRLDGGEVGGEERKGFASDRAFVRALDKLFHGALIYSSTVEKVSTHPCFDLIEISVRLPRMSMSA
jgi:hypothetical protein